MLSRFKEHAGIAALVIALVALFVALGGIAGALPAKNKVNSGDIKNNSVKSADVKDDSLTGGCGPARARTLSFPMLMEQSSSIMRRCRFEIPSAATSARRWAAPTT